MVTETQKAEVRRILGFPNLGNSASVQLGYPGFASVYSIWQPYAWLEYRFTTMSADEEVAIFGQESGYFSQYYTPSSLTLTISTPSQIATGAQLQVDVDGNAITVTAQANDTPQTFAARLATQIMQNNSATQAVLAASNGPAVTIISRAMGILGNGIVAQYISSDPSLLCSAGLGSPSIIGVGVTAGGMNPPGPSMTPTSGAQTIYGYVPIIKQLEDDLANVRENLDTTRADVYIPRVDEFIARKALLHRYRRELADRLGVPLDPDLVGNRRRGRMRYR